MKWMTDALAHDAYGVLAYNPDARVSPGGSYIASPRTTRYAFDALGRQTQVLVPYDQTGATYSTTQTFYDAFGNVVKVIDPAGNVGTFYFDKLNRQTLAVDPEGFVTKTDYAAPPTSPSL